MKSHISSADDDQIYTLASSPILFLEFAMLQIPMNAFFGFFYIVRSIFGATRQGRKRGGKQNFTDRMIK